MKSLPNIPIRVHLLSRKELPNKNSSAYLCIIQFTLRFTFSITKSEYPANGRNTLAGLNLIRYLEMKLMSKETIIVYLYSNPLWCEHADESRPVGKRTPYARSVACATAGTQQIIA